MPVAWRAPQRQFPNRSVARSGGVLRDELDFRAVNGQHPEVIRIAGNLVGSERPVMDDWLTLRTKDLNSYSPFFDFRCSALSEALEEVQESVGQMIARKENAERKSTEQRIWGAVILLSFLRNQAGRRGV